MLIHHKRRKSLLPQMSTPAFPEIDTTGISTMCLSNGQPEILLLSRNSNQMNMLCEVEHPYSSPSPYFLHLFRNSLHIIGALWQAYSTIVRHLVSAMGEVF